MARLSRSNWSWRREGGSVGGVANRLRGGVYIDLCSVEKITIHYDTIHYDKDADKTTANFD
jgi:hypothetical protein